MTFHRTEAHVELLDLLLGAVERACAASREARPDARELALAEAFDALSALYALLEPKISPEVSTHLARAYDACLSGLSDAYEGRPEDLEASVAGVRAIRAAFVPMPSSSRVHASRRAA